MIGVGLKLLGFTQNSVVKLPVLKANAELAGKDK